MANKKSLTGISYWPLQDAKAKLSELVKIVLTDGPQGISVHGRQEVIMLSKNEYNLLTQPKQNFAQFMQTSPLANIELEIKRDKSLTRDVEL